MTTDLRSGSRPDPARGLAAGLIGGLAGSLAMLAFQAAWARAIDPETRPGEHDVAGDDAADSDPAPSTLQATEALFGRSIPRRHAPAAARAFHFAFGTALGGLYGVIAEYSKLATIGAGVPFGLGQVLLADELIVPALGLAGNPGRAPASAHARSLAAHAVYGFATDWARRRVLGRA